MLRTTSFLATFLRMPVIPRLLAMILAVLVIFGIAIHVIEPENFPTIFEGIWWAIVTTSTVGYGDFSPTSIVGRLLGMLLILVGAGLVTSYFVLLSTSAITYQNSYLEGKTTYKGNRHFIIIGWNERAKETILKLTSHHKYIDVVLIDESLEKNPLPGNHVHFIKGNPTFDEILTKANIEIAEMVLITADQNKDEIQADMRSVITLLSIKGLNPDIYCIVEILTSQYIKNAQRAGADEIIETNHLSSNAMMNSIISNQRL